MQRIRSRSACSWAASHCADRKVDSEYPDALNGDRPTAAAWATPVAVERETTALFLNADRIDVESMSAWVRFLHTSRRFLGFGWEVTAPADRFAQAIWGRFSSRPSAHEAASWVVSAIADESALSPWGGISSSPSASIVFIVPASGEADSESVIPWDRFSRPLNPGWGVITEPGDPDDPDPATVIVPIRSAYIVLNSATLQLASNGQQIQHTGLSLQLDIDSWAWGWSASVPATYLDVLRPTGTDGFVELIATVNGSPFTLLIETLQRDRRFGRADLKIGGRSRSAWLTSPHAPTETRFNTEARTAQQLLNEALTTNGVSIGWAVDWQITDWLVPAGAWSHQGSYIDAAVRIAESAGAVVQPHPTDQTLRIIHRYPAAPWDWAAASADIAIPEDVVTVEGITWSDKPRYDAVYLAGTILGHVKRTGTSGGTVAPMVTDPLITHDDAARQRGRAILSDTGRQAQIKLSLPVLTETGIIQPGKLLQYTEQGVTRRGITRAVDVQCGWPAITQTITVETHEL